MKKTILLFLFSISIFAKSTCLNIYEKRIKNFKKYKLYSYYESQSLCGFIMSDNTISFNLDTIDEGSKDLLGITELEVLNYKGKWLNVFSKDIEKEVSLYSLSTYLVPKTKKCVTNIPMNSFQCAFEDPTILKKITELKDEKLSFYKVNL